MGRFKEGGGGRALTALGARVELNVACDEESNHQEHQQVAVAYEREEQGVHGGARGAAPAGERHPNHK